MMKKAVLCLMTLTLIMFLAVGCGHKEMPEEHIAVLDMEQAVENHPRWLEVIQIDTRLQLLRAHGEGVVADNRDSKAKLLDDHALLLETQSEEAERDQIEAEAKLDGLLAVRQSELQSKIDARSKEIELIKMKELQQYAKDTQKEYMPRLIDLQLKLKCLDQESEEKNKLLDQIDALEKEKREKIQAKREELESELEKELSAYTNELEKELNAYKAQEEGKIKSDLARIQKTLGDKEKSSESKAKEIHSKLEKNKAAQFAELKKKADELKAEREKIITEIKEDIKLKVAQLAKAEQIDVVIINYKKIFNAEDITAKVIDLCK